MALQAQQIITLALQIAKAPGFTSQAGQLLNMILQDLCQDYDFEIARKVFSWTFNSGTGNNSGPYTMPADFLRSVKDDVFYTIVGQPYVMIPIELAEYDRLSQTAGLASYPEFFASDMSQTPPVLYVWPPPSGSYPVTQRYYSLMPDITTPETSSVVPWFQNTNYLKTRLAAEVMQITDDERALIKRWFEGGASVQ